MSPHGPCPKGACSGRRGALAKTTAYLLLLLMLPHGEASCPDHGDRSVRGRKTTCGAKIVRGAEDAGRAETVTARCRAGKRTVPRPVFGSDGAAGRRAIGPRDAFRGRARARRTAAEISARAACAVESVSPSTDKTLLRVTARKHRRRRADNAARRRDSYLRDDTLTECRPRSARVEVAREEHAIQSRRVHRVTTSSRPAESF